MANFERLLHFQSFVPNLGNNRDLLADQLTLELAVGMTKVELVAFMKAPAGSRIQVETFAAGDEAGEAAAREALQKSEAAYIESLAAAWSPFIRMGPGSHSINGKPVVGLAGYLAAVLEQPGIFNFIELQSEVRRLNSVEGTRALFSAPPAGGSTSTAAKSSAPAGSQTGGR